MNTDDMVTPTTTVSISFDKTTFSELYCRHSKQAACQHPRTLIAKQEKKNYSRSSKLGMHQDLSSRGGPAGCLAWVAAKYFIRRLPVIAVEHDLTIWVQSLQAHYNPK